MKTKLGREQRKENQKEKEEVDTRRRQEKEERRNIKGLEITVLKENIAHYSAIKYCFSLSLNVICESSMYSCIQVSTRTYLETGNYHKTFFKTKPTAKLHGMRCQMSIE